MLYFYNQKKYSTKIQAIVEIEQLEIGETVKPVKWITKNEYGFAEWTLGDTKHYKPLTDLEKVKYL